MADESRTTPVEPAKGGEAPASGGSKPADAVAVKPADDAAAKPTAKQAKADEPEPERFTVEDLAERSVELGFSRHALAGALAGESRKTHTVEQARDAVKKFLKREIDVPDETDEG